MDEVSSFDKSDGVMMTMQMPQKMNGDGYDGVEEHCANEY